MNARITAIGRRLAAAFRPNDEAARLQQQVDDLTRRVDAHEEILRTAAAQLNHNTTTMQRWAKGSATLLDLERKHYREAKRSSLLTLDEAIGQ